MAGHPPGIRRRSVRDRAACMACADPPWRDNRNRIDCDNPASRSNSTWSEIPCGAEDPFEAADRRDTAYDTNLRKAVVTHRLRRRSEFFPTNGLLRPRQAHRHVARTPPDLKARGVPLKRFWLPFGGTSAPAQRPVLQK